MSVSQLMKRFDTLLSTDHLKNDDVVTFFKTLNDFQAVEAKRYAFDDEVLSIFEAVLSKYHDDLVDQSSIWIEMFRFLRNYVALSRDRQNNVVRSSQLFEASIQRVLYLINELSRLSSPLLMMPELRCGIQFFGNLVTDNDENKRLLATRILSKANVLMTFEDEILKKYSSMLIYNVMIGLEDVRDSFLYSSHNAEEVVSLFLSADGSEWCWFAIEYFLESSAFLETFYSKLESNQRIMLLDVLQSTIKDMEKGSCNRRIEVPFSNLSFLANRYLKNTDVILQMKNSSSEMVEPLEMMRCLNVLCIASAVTLYLVHLQSFSELLCLTIVLLKSVHMAGKEASKNCFTPIESLKNYEKEHSSNNPSDGLKCLLIRLISNLCWRNKTNQNKVREFDGIPLLLDCCKLDAKNPFIIQCVIFAIRNLCEDNVENQNVIASMDKQELPPSSSLLEELGFKRSEDTDSNPVIKSEYDTESKVEQTRRDIRDLFL